MKDKTIVVGTPKRIDKLMEQFIPKIRLEWKDGYTQEFRMLESLIGIRHNGERPWLVTIAGIASQYYPSRKEIEWLNNSVAPCLHKDSPMFKNTKGILNEK